MTDQHFMFIEDQFSPWMESLRHAVNDCTAGFENLVLGFGQGQWLAGGLLTKSLLEDYARPMVQRAMELACQEHELKLPPTKNPAGPVVTQRAIRQQHAARARQVIMKARRR